VLWRSDKLSHFCPDKLSHIIYTITNTPTPGFYSSRKQKRW